MRTRSWIFYLWPWSLLGLMSGWLTACAAPGRTAPTAPPTPNRTLTAVGGTARRSPAPPTPTLPSPTPTLPPPPDGLSSPACANPYLPVRQGATWDYRLSNDVTDTFTRPITEVTPDGFVDQDEFSAGAVRRGRWQCENGSLIYLTLGPVAGSVFAGPMQTEVTLESNQGFYHPADLHPGQTWQQKTVFKGKSTLEGAGVLESRSEVNYACRAEAFETVTVPAGTFEAVRVTCETHHTLTLAVGMTFELTTHSTLWLARGVGLVKAIDKTEGPPSTLELLAYHLP